MLEPVDQFRAALAGRGILPKGGEVIADGRIHRCDAEGRGGKGDAAYLLHLDGVPAGGFENWRDGFGWENWRADTDRTLSPAEEAAHRAKLENSRRERELEELKRKATARKRALSVFEDAALCHSHPYTVRKGIQPHGARLQGDRLVLPLRDADGTVHSLQFIGADGAKRYLTGGRKAGCYFDIGESNDVLCLTEGFATGASIHEATGYAVAVAFDAGNLAAVPAGVRSRCISSLAIRDYAIFPLDFFRLRDLTLRRSFAMHIGGVTSALVSLSGQNLLWWKKAKNAGIDAETSGGFTTGNTGMTQQVRSVGGSIPIPRTYLMSVRLTL